MHIFYSNISFPFRYENQPVDHQGSALIPEGAPAFRGADERPLYTHKNPVHGRPWHLTEWTKFSWGLWWGGGLVKKDALPSRPKILHFMHFRKIGQAVGWRPIGVRIPSLRNPGSATKIVPWVFFWIICKIEDSWIKKNIELSSLRSIFLWPFGGGSRILYG